MSAEEKTPEMWPPRVQLKTPPYSLPLDFPAPPGPSGHKLLIMTVGAVTALAISVLGVLLATYLGREHCAQKDVSSFLVPQLNVQNEASLLLAFSELSDQGSAPGITCDLKNHVMVYHGQAEGCVARKMDVGESLPSCQDLETYFQAVLRNITLGLSLDVQVVGVGSLGNLVTLLCNNKPTYLLSTLPGTPLQDDITHMLWILEAGCVTYLQYPFYKLRIKATPVCLHDADPHLLPAPLTA